MDLGLLIATLLSLGNLNGQPEINLTKNLTQSLFERGYVSYEREEIYSLDG